MIKVYFLHTMSPAGSVSSMVFPVDFKSPSSSRDNHVFKSIGRNAPAKQRNHLERAETLLLPNILSEVRQTVEPHSNCSKTDHTWHFPILKTRDHKIQDRFSAVLYTKLAGCNFMSSPLSRRWQPFLGRLVGLLLGRPLTS